jgi:serine/threonine protein kinase
MPPILASITVCSRCREPLSSKGECLVCLLRAGLEEPGKEAVSFDSLVFGDFEIARREDGSFWELGCGAMGVTYRATDKVLHRTVALKVIEVPASAGDSRTVRERFLREARSAAALRHPNVAGIFQFGASPEINRCYYAMELVEGETLEARVRRDGPLKVGAALEIAAQVARALVAAAAQGLIHRDLKPGNIMLTRSASEADEIEVKVIDFGLAKTMNAVGQMDLTHGAFVGTPTFASPEQFNSGPIDARSDIYSLGVTLWYALTGDVPYPGKTIEEIRDRQTSADLPIKQLTARKIPNPIRQLLRFTLAVDPLKRPASARELTESIESCRRKLGHILPNEAATIRNRRRLLAFIVAGTAAALALATFSLTQRKPAPFVSSTASRSQKSIAVLPFENLSDEKENAFFADGMQDDILTSLAKISALKVISRTSVSQYRGAGADRNLPEIAQALGVENILEGSVRRAGNRVLLNVQLIDAHNDRHIWAEHYDRDLADVFAIQSEIAQQIADQLRSKVSPQEKAALANKPTQNTEAYDLYLRAKELIHSTSLLEPASVETISNGVNLLDKAVARDPNFALAYCLLAQANLSLYWKHESVPRARERAEVALQAARRLAPEAGETYLAEALFFYWGKRDYDHALESLEKAARLSPNSANVFRFSAWVERRLGRWKDAIRHQLRAAELDPRDWNPRRELITTYTVLRNYTEAERLADRAIADWPERADHFRAIKAEAAFDSGDLKTARASLDSLSAPDAGFNWQLWTTAMLERNYDEAGRVLNVWAQRNEPGDIDTPRILLEAMTARAAGQTEKARAAFLATRQHFVELLRDRNEQPTLVSQLAIVDAGLGQEEEALQEAQRAVDLLAVSRDAMYGPGMKRNLGLVYSWLGDRDHAIEQLSSVATLPGGPSYGELKFDPVWDELRGDPRFEKIVAGLAPKTVY